LKKKKKTDLTASLMDQFNTYSKSSNMPSFTTINNNERSSATYGDGYVYTGPLSAQQYELQSKSISEIPKQATSYNDGQNFGSSSSSPTTTNPSLSSSPSTEIVTTSSNQYQFKVMLLGDSGVGKFFFLYISLFIIDYN